MKVKSFVTSVCSAISLFICSSALFAQTIDKPHVVQQKPQQQNSPAATGRGGAHGAYDPHNRLTPESHVQVALQHKAEGRMGEALQTLDKAISLNPQSAELLAVRGSFYMEQNNISMALKDFESALIIDPQSAAILTNRAQAYRHFGRIAEAIEDLNQAVRFNPRLLAAYFNRGAIHYSSEEFTLALQDFDRCIALDPHAAAPYFNRAATHDAMGNRQPAIADIKRFIEISDNPAWRNSAQQLLDRWQTPVSELSDKKSDS